MKMRFLSSSIRSDRPKESFISISVGPKHFDVIKLIGEGASHSRSPILNFSLSGAFGKVFVVRNLIDKRVYAMKVRSPPSLSSHPSR
jgi:hypothetical protein